MSQQISFGGGDPISGLPAGATDCDILIYNTTLGAWEVKKIDDCLKYKGLFDANTGTPVLTDASGEAGWLYSVIGIGSPDFGSGPIPLEDGMFLIHNGAAWIILEIPSSTSSFDNGTTSLVSDNVQDAIEEIDFAFTSLAFGSGLLSGLVQWSGTGLTYDYTPLTYKIDGVSYVVLLPGNFTLDPADPTNPRLDTIFVDTASNIGFITGVPAPNPIAPQVGANQLAISVALVGAGATTPTIPFENIYLENVEWASSSNAPTEVNFLAATDPFEGIVHVDYFAGMGNGRLIRFIRSTPFTVPSTTAQVEINIKLTQALPVKSNLVARFRLGGVVIGSRTIALAYGFNRNLVGIWQKCVIALSQFGINSGNQVDWFEISFGGLAAANTGQIFFDSIRIAEQGGLRYGPQIGARYITFDNNGTPIVAENVNDAIIEAGTQGLPSVLGNDNTTDGNDISINTGDSIVSGGTTGHNINLDNGGILHIGNDPSAGTGDGLYLEPDYISLFAGSFNQKIELDEVSKIVNICSSREVKLDSQGITGVTVLRSSDPLGRVLVQSDNFQLQPITGLSFTHKLTGAPTADRTVTFQDKDCTVACLSDIPAYTFGEPVRAIVVGGANNAWDDYSFSASGITFTSLPNGVGSTIEQRVAGDGVFGAAGALEGITSFTVGDRLIVNLRDNEQNGVYEITTLGDGATVKWKLTRTSDFSNVNASTFVARTYHVLEGNPNGENLYTEYLRDGSPITWGTTHFRFKQTVISKTWSERGCINAILPATPLTTSLRREDGASYSDSPVIVPEKCRVYGVTAYHNDAGDIINPPEPFQIEILKNGVVVHTTPQIGGQVGYNDLTLNLPYDAGDTLQMNVIVSTAGTRGIYYPSAEVYFTKTV